MNARRTVLAFTLALAISGFLPWSITRTFRAKATVPSRPLGNILVAAKDVPAGEVLAAGSVVLTEWASREALPGSVTDPAVAVGRVPLVPLVSGEPILLRKLAELNLGQGISVTIPRGMRAVTVRGPDVGTVSSFLGPGDLVDVLATFHPQGLTEPASSTVLQAVRVFAVGDHTSPDHDRESSATTSITLLVPASEVPKLNLAMAGGRILLAMRNGADTAKDAYTVEDSTHTKSSAQAPSPAVLVQSRIQSHVHPADAFTVETIAGGKLTSQTFQEAAQ